MPARTHHRSRAAQLLAIIAVAVLAVAVAALAMLALTQSKGNPTTAPVTPVPTFTLGVDDDAEASPSPTAQTVTAFEPSEERFLAVDSGVMWRGVAGECGVTAPVIERSTDDGATWIDVTPTYREIAQLLSLESFADGQAEAIALIGPDCEAQALRTFTQGEFWQPYAEVLANATYISPAESGTVVLAGAEVAAPCAAPHGLRTAAGNTALICDDTAYVLNTGLADGPSANEWLAIETGVVVAIAASSDSIAIAHLSESCDGLAMTNLSPEETTTESRRCVEGVDALLPTVVALLSPEGYLLWSGDSPVIAA